VICFCGNGVLVNVVPDRSLCGRAVFRQGKVPPRAQERDRRGAQTTESGRTWCVPVEGASASLPAGIVVNSPGWRSG
jgi:hypothetical protein